jgi:hypothetical protein
MTDETTYLADLSSAIAAIERNNGNQSAAARELGIGRTTLRYRATAAALRGLDTAANKLETLHGKSPDGVVNFPLPNPLVLKGASFLQRTGNPDVPIIWHKTKVDQELAFAAMQDYLAELCKELPSYPPTELAGICNEDLLSLYIITDLHIGSRSWAPECGKSWDIKVMRKVLFEGIDYLISRSPPSKYCYIGQLGDFLDHSGIDAKTPRSGHILDTDSRLQKMINVAVDVLLLTVKKCLEKHEIVYLLCINGNHDEGGSAEWIQALLPKVYANEPRVKIIRSSNQYPVYEFGSNMLGFCHGDLAKAGELAQVYADLYSGIWGRTKHREIHRGHRHFYESIYKHGCTLTQHPTICAKNAYSARNFPGSPNQELISYTYHRERGKISATHYKPE